MDYYDYYGVDNNSLIRKWFTNLRTDMFSFQKFQLLTLFQLLSCFRYLAIEIIGNNSVMMNKKDKMEVVI